VARVGASKSFFTGAVLTPSVDDLDAWVSRAARGERFVYCEAPELIRNATCVRVTELAAERLVSPLWERRAGGGKRFFVERTGFRIERRPSAKEAALADVATDLIYREVKRAANLGLACPSDEDLRKKARLTTRAQAQWRYRKLVETGLIESTLAYEGGVPFRVATVVATGKSTALPPKWAALQRAAGRGA
jgi:hypothetical protein